MSSSVPNNLSYEAWSKAAEQIFRQPFLDQLRATSKGDLKIEVEQCYEYVQSDKGGTHLRDEDDVQNVALALGVQAEEERNDQDHRQQLHRMMKSYIADAYSMVTNAESNRVVEPQKACRSKENQGRSKENDGLSQGHTPDDPNTQVKRTISSTQKENIMETGERVRVPPGRAFTFQCNANLRSVKHYPSPRHAFHKTKTFERIKNMVTDGNDKILHIYGMSGSGKSQIALSLCKELDRNWPNFLIWHVQCQTTGGVLVREWQSFVQKLELFFPVTVPTEDVRVICSDLEELESRSFIRKMNAIEFDVLLVIEDVADASDKALVRSMLMELQASVRRNVQLVIVTQKLDALYMLGDIKEIDQYEGIKVTGFEEKEAIEFLKNIPREEQNIPQKETVVAKLAEELAYSPLRLFLAGIYCSKFNISYEEYYNSLGKDSDIIEKEREILSRHPELGKHTYEVIMKIFKPSAEDEHVQFEVIKMMSFLNNCAIPDILLGAFFREIRQFETVREEQRQVKYLLHRLEEECDLNVWTPLIKPEEYGQQNVTIHNDILSAIRWSVDPAEKRETVIKVLRAIISLVGKENRFRTDNILLFDMTNHMNQVAEFAGHLIEIDFNPDKPKPEDFEIQMCLSRLYEVLCFASTQTSGKTKDKNFGKAIDYLWGIACYYTGVSIFKSLFGKGKKMADKHLAQLHYEIGKDPAETAKKAYKRLSDSSNKIPLASIMKSCSRFFPITINSLKDMKSKLEGKQIDWDKVEKDLKERRQLEEIDLQVLWENKMILTPKKLRSIYLTECIASILHSRGRQILYLKESISREEQCRYEWYTDVGLELCKCMSKHTGIKTIYEYIIRANNMLPRMLHSRMNETDDQFWSRIEKSRKMALELLEEKGDFHEHGVYKVVSGTPYTVINVFKYLLKASTKLHKRPEVAERHAVPTAIAECEQLYQMAKENACKFVVASSCMIYVGKYYAAIKEDNKAHQAFEDGFDYRGHGINSALDKNVNSYAWALYNCGRALHASGGNVDNFGLHAERFLERYKILCIQIPMQWKEKLDKVKLSVEALVSGSRNRA